MPASLVNLREYSSFCLRGEGQANFVISAKHVGSGLRIVWRFAKSRKSGLMAVKAKSELVNNYMERIVTHFFSRDFLVNPRIVEFRINDVHQIGKIPSLAPNVKMNFEELSQLPDEDSFLPFSSIPKGVTRLSALEMVDATSIPRDLPFLSGQTITIEVKPKQGFFQCHPNVNIPYCNNCLLQTEKCGSGRFGEMYDFCPLDLYSGSYSRMRQALLSLFHCPHRNLRVFVNGNEVHSDKKKLDPKIVDDVLFPEKNATLDDLVNALCFILSGSQVGGLFHLYDGSVLKKLLDSQLIDSIGLGEACNLYNRLPDTVKDSMKDKTRFARKGLKAILRESDDANLIERYLISATMKDCSLMVSLKLVPPDVAVPNQRKGSSGVVTLEGGIRFLYSIKVVDLDPKSHKHLANAYKRLQIGGKLIQMDIEQGFRRKPCIST